MVAFMHTGTRLTAGYRYTTLGDATVDRINSMTERDDYWLNDEELASFMLSLIHI